MCVCVCVFGVRCANGWRLDGNQHIIEISSFRSYFMKENLKIVGNENIVLGLASEFSE